jgi:AI-2 transport protein TqsA
MSNAESTPQRSPTFAHTMLVLATLVIVVAGMRAASSILVPFLIAGFLTVLFAPIQARLLREGVPKWLALTLMLGSICLVGFFLLVVVGSSLASFTSQLEVYETELSDKIDRLLGRISAAFELPQADRQSLAEQLRANDVLGYIARALAQLSAVLGNAAFILMMFAFLLAETPQLLAKGAALQSRGRFPMNRLEELGSDIVRYFAMKTWISLATGISLGLLYWLLGIDAPILWAFIGFVLNFIPSIGSFLAAIPPLLLTVAQPGLSPLTWIWLLTGVGAINTVFGNIIETRVVGKGLDLSTTVVLLSLLFWGWVLGPIGMLLSVPSTVAVKLGLELDPRTRAIALLLGSRVPEDPPEDSGSAPTPA